MSMQTMIVFEGNIFYHSIAETIVLRVFIFLPPVQEHQLLLPYSDCKCVNLSDLSAPKMLCL